MEGLRLQHRTDLPHRVADIPEALTVEASLARAVIQIEHQPHRRGLTGAVRPQETSHDAGPDIKGQVIDRDLVPITLTQPVSRDHYQLPISTIGLETRLVVSTVKKEN